MTKRVLISFLLLLCALCLSVVSFALLQNKIAALGQALENAVYTDAPPEESFVDVEREAKDCMTWLRILTPHKDLQTLSVTLETLPDLCAHAEDYRSACVKCIRLLREIEDEQRTCKENILYPIPFQSVV